jgi:hypothetical protein
MLKIGNVTALPSVCRHHVTNTTGTITSPSQIVGTNTTCLIALIGNKTRYYPTFSIFLYLQKQPTHIATFRCQLQHYPQFYPNTAIHRILYYVLTFPYSSPFVSPVALLICISVQFITFLTHSCKTGIFTC